MILIYVRKFLPFHRSIISTVIEAISLPSSSRKLRPFDMICLLYTSFAPYTMKYLQIVVLGECIVEQIQFKEYKNSSVLKRIHLPQDTELALIFLWMDSP